MTTGTSAPSVSPDVDDVSAWRKARLVLFAHPPFMRSQSMPRFAGMLLSAFSSRGLNAEIWSPKPFFYRLAPNSRASKWLGYIDQYLIFPILTRIRLRQTAGNTLFVFCDQALGPWVPLVADRPHVVHCHDFLALRSALDMVPENPTSLTGKIYQSYIRHGFRKAKVFISVSNRTKSDLYELGGLTDVSCDVVYNGLAYPYAPMTLAAAKKTLQNEGHHLSDDGILLHVGGGQWYKNTSGVIRIYAEYCRRAERPLPLWIVGPSPSDAVAKLIAQLPTTGSVVFVKGLSARALNSAYAAARLLLFPSHAEGFGWPIIEAQASGCPVLTTNEAPMNEIGGPAPLYIPRLQMSDDAELWARNAAQVVLVHLSQDEVRRRKIIEAGIDWAKRFDAHRTIESYLTIYSRTLGIRGEMPAKPPEALTTNIMDCD